ncbi:MAG: hypothetical protein IPM81_01865 [Saprospirales bacterium]|nr:hypothetical protein [Saprospirales bacterium]
MKKYFNFIWWITFLIIIKKKGINCIFAKVKSKNKYAFKLATKLGFGETSINSGSLIRSNQNPLLSRGASLNQTELLFIQKITGQLSATDHAS